MLDSRVTALAHVLLLASAFKNWRAFIIDFSKLARNNFLDAVDLVDHN